MTPVYLNPPPSSFPFVELKEDHQQQQQLFLPPHVHVAQDQDQRGNSLQNDHHEVDKLYISQSRWSDHHQHNPLSSCKIEEHIGDNYYYEGNGGEGSSSSAKWMLSKMRLMQKMINSNCSSSEPDKPEKFILKFQDNNYNNTTTTIRVCADCNTTTTPLWRSGPRGPKSLCNACGIRQRKAKRAMAAAATMANGPVVAMETSASLLSTKNKVHNKKKKSRSTSHNSQGKKLLSEPLDHPPQGQKKICFKNFALSLSKNSALQRVFPQDVEQAAILLMELSCGFIHR